MRIKIMHALVMVALVLLATQLTLAVENIRVIKLDNPTSYSFPRTMLSYPVIFPTGVVALTRDMRLTDEKDTLIPFQLTDSIQVNNALVSGTLNFVSDLPSGMTHTFTLKAPSKGEVDNWERPPAKSPVVSTRNNGAVTLTNGFLSIVFPAPGDYAGDKVTGPMMKILQNGTLCSTASLHLPGWDYTLKVANVENGDLVQTYSLTYSMKDNAGVAAQYKIILRAQAEMPFIDVIEEGTNVGNKDGQYWEMDFSSMNPTQRFNQFVGDVGNATRWEPIDAGLRPGTGEWPIRVAPFYPKDNRFRHQMIGVKNGADVFGISIRRTEQWTTDRYPVWSSDRYSGAFFFTVDGKTTARFPVANGTQRFAFTAYPVAQSYAPLVANTVWHEILDLDKVKDQVLSWPDDVSKHEQVFEPAGKLITTGQNLASGIGGAKNAFFGWLNEGFTMGGGAKNPSQADRDLKAVIKGLDAGYPQVKPADLRLLQGNAAITAYIHAGDSYYPDTWMIGGHPNFMGDAKTPPGTFATVLANSPAADTWRDHSEHALEMLLRYHTRPEVNTWQAQGGRWTENPSCYLPHCLTAWEDCFAAMRYHGDHRNIFAKPSAADLGTYMTNLPSAPYNGVRVITQQGAHSGDIFTPGESFRVLGLALRDYSPLVAENLIWDSRIGEKAPAGNLAGVLGTKEALAEMGEGTAPLLESQKFTGYGLTMRRDVGTPNELFLNMQQIDLGPNYRWGRAGEGGNGCLYFYADGKRYTSHSGEDVGDASKTDTEASTNFGVWRDQSSGISRLKVAGQREPDRKDREGMFYSIGLRELTEPFYPFQVAQYGRLLADTNYAGPDYRARAVLLVGGDYFLVHDEITNPEAEGRFSWSTSIKDTFPEIQQLKPGAPAVDKTDQYLRRSYTGKGDFLTLVSSKPGYTGKVTDFGVEVTYAGGKDLLFTGLGPIKYDQDGVRFSGTTGVVRQRTDGKTTSVALYGAGEIGVGNMTLRTTGDVGVSAEIAQNGIASGELFSQAGGTFQVDFAVMNEIPTIFIDGVEIKGLTATITPGKHIWQLYRCIPVRPNILRTANGVGEYTIYWNTVAGADSYRLESDKTGTWTTLAKDLTGGNATVKIAEVGKIHLRLIAVSKDGESAPSAQYPLYVGTAASRAPDGLKVDMYARNIFWGQVLGAKEYVLERHVKGQKNWIEVYRGSDTSFADPKLPTMDEYKADTKLPTMYGYKADPKLPIYEYRVGAYNGNGGAMNELPRDTDPTSILNIDPMPGERFRRVPETYESYPGSYDQWKEAYLPVLPAYPK
ncbi:MAG: hypothetical protein WCJ56_02700 [bacterium]